MATGLSGMLSLNEGLAPHKDAIRLFLSASGNKPSLKTLSNDVIGVFQQKYSSTAAYDSSLKEIITWLREILPLCDLETLNLYDDPTNKKSLPDIEYRKMQVRTTQIKKKLKTWALRLGTAIYGSEYQHISKRDSKVCEAETDVGNPSILVPDSVLLKEAMLAYLQSLSKEELSSFMRGMVRRLTGTTKDDGDFSSHYSSEELSSLLMAAFVDNDDNNNRHSISTEETPITAAAVPCEQKNLFGSFANFNRSVAGETSEDPMNIENQPNRSSGNDNSSKVVETDEHEMVVDESTQKHLAYEVEYYATV
jgi:hypothetical protein